MEEEEQELHGGAKDGQGRVDGAGSRGATECPQRPRLSRAVNLFDMLWTPPSLLRRRDSDSNTHDSSGARGTSPKKLRAYKSQAKPFV